MGLTKYKLGELIEDVDLRNKDVNSKYKETDVKGISIDKIFIETKANLKNVSLSPYKLVQPHQFAYVTVTSRNGEKISLAYNQNEETYLVSSSYNVFKVNNTEALDPSFLFMYFNRPEFDRFSRFNSWGSARETFSWEDFCDIEVKLPSIEIQKKYVAIYQAMLENQEAYEEGLEDLKLACDGTIEELKHKNIYQKIGNFIKDINVKNENEEITLAQGVNVDKVFIPAKRVASDIKNTKIVTTGQFAFNKVMKANGTLLPIALRKGPTCFVSSSYQVFEVEKSKELNPEYLMLWLTRGETQRYAGYISWGSTRDSIDFETFCEIEIPVPDINTQKSIANIYKVYTERKEINEKLKEQIKSMCPILIKGTMEEARREEV